MEGTNDQLSIHLENYSTLAFNLVNQGPAATIPMHHDVQHRAQEVDRRSIYDLPEEHSKALRWRSKRKRAPSNHIRRNTFPHLEVLQHSDAKKYSKGFVQTTEPAESKPLQIGATAESRRKSAEEQSLLHKQKQSELPVLPIIKSHRHQKTAGTKVKQSRVVSYHTTTDDMIRSARNIIGKSTVEKLSTFMYNPPSTTALHEPGPAAAEDSRPDTFIALLDFKSSAELQNEEDIVYDQPAFSTRLHQASLSNSRSNSPIEEASLDSKPTLNEFVEPDTNIVTQCTSGIETSINFNSSTCVTVELPGIEYLRNESDEFQDQELQDEDLFDIADSVIENVPQRVRFGDEIRSGIFLAHGTEMARSPFSPNLDIEGCFMIDKDAELAMAARANVESKQHSSSSPMKALDWGLVNKHGRYSNTQLSTSRNLVSNIASSDEVSPDYSSDYSPLRPFARPDFPSKVRDRSPVTGFTSSAVLRTCFRLGEAIRTGGICNAQKQDAVIELFARIKYSSRESSTFRQHFQFADLFHDRPPFLNAFLDNFKISALQEKESSDLLGEVKAGQLVRSIGRLMKGNTGSGRLFQIINVRATDWEEVRWTKMIAGAGMVN